MPGSNTKMYSNNFKILTLTCIFSQFSPTFHLLPTQQNPFLSNCTYHLIQKLFTKNEPLVLVTSFGSELDWILRLRHSRVVLTTSKPITGPLNHFYNFVIFLRQPLEQVIGLLRTSPVWNESETPRGKFVIITETASPESVFRTIWGYDIANVLVVVVDGVRVPVVYYSSPMEKGNACGRAVKVKDAHECSPDPNVTFRTEWNDIGDCRINYVTPSVIVEDYRVSGSLAVLTEVTRILAGTLNANMNVIVHENFTDLLQNRDYDISITPLLVKLLRTLQFLDAIQNVIYTDPMHWYVPKAPYISGMRMIPSVFTFGIWMSILVMMLVTFLACWMIGRSLREDSFETIHGTILEVLRMTLFCVTHPVPTTNPLRILVAFYIIGAISITNLFQARLFGALMRPGRDYQIGTLQEMYDSDSYALAALRYAHHQVIDLDKDLRVLLNVRLALRVEAYLGDCIREAARNTNYTVASSERFMRAYPKESEKLYQIPGNAGGIPDIDVSYGIRKGHYFLSVLNKLSLRIMESGLIERIIKAKPRSEASDGRMRLSLDHFLGVFLWWAAGLLVAFITFIGEIANVSVYEVFRRRTCCIRKTPWKKASCAIRRMVKVKQTSKDLSQNVNKKETGRRLELVQEVDGY